MPAAIRATRCQPPRWHNAADRSGARHGRGGDRADTRLRDTRAVGVGVAHGGRLRRHFFVRPLPAAERWPAASGAATRLITATWRSPSSRSTGVRDAAARPLALRHGTRWTATAGRSRRLGDAGGGRRRTPRGRGQPGDRRVRCLARAGPIHLGNLREFLTPHFVAEELRRRGVAGAPPPLLGRLRPVPQGAGRRARRVGRPHRAPARPPSPTRGSATPAGPSTSRHRCRTRCASSASRWRRSRQTEMYTSGAYREQVLTAVSRRDEIEAVLARHRTKKVAPAEDASDAGGRRPRGVGRQRGRRPDRGSPTRSPASPTAPTAASAAATPSPRTSYDDATTTLSYTCTSCGFEGTTNLSTDNDGKLVWKVDWPMRWAYETVDFEPAGRDHMTPGSSYTVGTEIVSSIFDWRAPARVDLRVRRLRRRAEDVVVGGGVPTADRRAADPRGADAALALRPPRAQRRPSTSTSVPRSCGCTTSGTRSAARPPTPPRRRRDAGLAPRLRDGVRRPAAHPAGRRSRSGRCRRSPT